MQVTIPGSVTVNGVTMHIIDTTDKTADDAIETSVVLVLVVDTSNQQAIDRYLTVDYAWIVFMHSRP